TETITVPGGVTSVNVRLWGGSGGGGVYQTGIYSGAGGYVEASFPVSPGDTLKIEVAQGGRPGVGATNGGGGGWPDGGPGSRGDTWGGGGGGSRRFFVNKVPKGLSWGAGGGGG